MLLLLPAKTSAVLKEKSYKRDIIKSFGSGSAEIIFLLPRKIVTSYIVIISIFVRKAYLKELF